MTTGMKIAVFFVGEMRDAGFNASALAGADAAAAEGLAEISIISGVRFDQDVSTAA
jgi:basic membrane protein A and related proteins